MVLQVDMWGEDRVTAVSGKILCERAFTQSLGVTNMPTTLFLGPYGAEIFRLLGFIGPFLY